MARVTINAIAKYAGVSRGTVDRVLNCRPHVKDDVREKIISAMKELGYVPPHEHQADALGLVVPDTSFCKIGIILPDWSGYFRQEINKGVDDALLHFNKSGTKILIKNCESDTPRELVSRIDELIAEDVKGIAICPVDHPMINKKLSALMKSGIKIVTYNSDTSNAKNRLCYIGQDEKKGGSIAACLVEKMTTCDDKIIVGVGNPNYFSHSLRMNSFIDKLKTFGYKKKNFIIVQTFNDYMTSYNLIREELKKDKSGKIKAVYMANHSVEGCVDAVFEIKPESKIHIISHDLTDSTMEYLRSGNIDFVLSQDIRSQGYYSLLSLDSLVRGLDKDFSGNGFALNIFCKESL